MVNNFYRRGTSAFWRNRPLYYNLHLQQGETYGNIEVIEEDDLNVENERKGRQSIMGKSGLSTWKQFPRYLLKIEASRVRLVSELQLNQIRLYPQSVSGRSTSVYFSGHFTQIVNFYSRPLTLRTLKGSS